MKFIRYYTVLFFCLIAAYLLATYLIPPDASVLTKYSLSSSQAKILSTTVALPLVLIWCVAFVALKRITRYAHKVRKQREGKGFALITKGIAVLVIGLPLTSLSSRVLNYLVRTYPSSTASTTIINNYIAVLILLIGFYFISRGTHMLLQQTRVNTISLPPLIRVIFIFFSVLFIYLTFTNASRFQAAEGVQRAVYYLPDWLIASTIVLPYMAAWYLGFTAAYELGIYSKRVAGILYKNAFNYISMGLMVVIAASILLRFLINLNSFFEGSQLRALLMTLYLLLLVISSGYILIGIGAKKLKKIEEV